MTVSLKLFSVSVTIECDGSAMTLTIAPITTGDNTFAGSAYKVDSFGREFCVFNNADGILSQELPFEPPEGEAGCGASVTTLDDDVRIYNNFFVIIAFQIPNFPSEFNIVSIAYSGSKTPHRFSKLPPSRHWNVFPFCQVCISTHVSFVLRFLHIYEIIVKYY